MFFNRRLRQYSLIPGFICWIYAVNVPAQPPLQFDRIGREDGLSQNSVNCMIRDREGFMWFGTQDGLNRYDGRKFRIFQNQPGDSASLSNNYILSVCEDGEGYIWIGTMAGGLNRLDRRTGQIRVFQHSFTAGSISENTIWAVLSDGKGNIWAGSNQGLNCYNKRTGQFTLYNHTPEDTSGIPTEMVISLYQDRGGQLWVGTVEGLCRLNRRTGKFTTYFNPAEDKMEGANIIWSVGGTPSGKIVTGTNNGVWLLDPASGRFSLISDRQSTAPVVAWSVYCESDGSVWAGTTQGLFRISPEEKISRGYLHNPADPQSISDNNVWCIYPDPAGFLWMGTQNGVCKSKSSATRFSLLNGDSAQIVRLSSPKVMSVLEDRAGRLWIGTDGGGLNCLNREKSKNMVYTSSNSGLRNDAVWALTEDPGGNIWIGNYQGGLHVFDPVTQTIKALPSGPGHPYALHNDRIMALLAGPEGEIWIGTRSGGLVRYDPHTGIFSNYLLTPGDTAFNSGNSVLSLAFDRRNRLWVGLYEGGLKMLVPKTNRFISFRKNAADPASLSDDNIWSILFDSRGRLWLATQGGLNYCTDPGETMRFSYLGTRDGLKSNTLFGLAEDEAGNIWMSSFNGLTRLDIHSFESAQKAGQVDEEYSLIRPMFRTFDTDQGLQGPEFNQGAYHRGHSGTIYFGGSRGLNFFNTGDVQESLFPGPVVITGLKVFNREVVVTPDDKIPPTGRMKLLHRNNRYTLPADISEVTHLVLTYRESVLSFEFAALDYTSPVKNRYAYRLEGFDREWNEVGTQNTATYTNLRPGDYNLRIRGTNADGIWNPEETALAVTIMPPVWKTGWFLAFLAGLTAFLAWRFIHNQRKKARREKEFTELQLRTIKSQIDPHFAFNALNTVASLIYEGHPDVTYDYFTRFAMMIRKILNDNERISLSLREEIDFVRNYLELQKIRFKDKFDYVISVDETIAPATQVPKMIIQTFAENAVKHGLMHRMKDGLLSIRVEKPDPAIRILIEDNGVGREKAAGLGTVSTGKGLKIIGQIIGLYQKLYHTVITQDVEDLTDENGNPAGTRVILTICPSSEQSGKSPFFRKIFRNDAK